MLRSGDPTDRLVMRVLVEQLEEAEVERIRAEARLIGQEVAQTLAGVMLGG